MVAADVADAKSGPTSLGAQLFAEAAVAAGHVAQLPLHGVCASGFVSDFDAAAAASALLFAE